MSNQNNFQIPFECNIASKIFNKTYLHCLSLSMATLTTLLNKLKLLKTYKKTSSFLPGHIGFYGLL